MDYDPFSTENPYGLSFFFPFFLFFASFSFFCVSASIYLYIRPSGIFLILHISSILDKEEGKGDTGELYIDEDHNGEHLKIMAGLAYKPWLKVLLPDLVREKNNVHWLISHGL